MLNMKRLTLLILLLLSVSLSVCSNFFAKNTGLVTGSVEVVAQKVTDITSLGVLVYDIATDEATRTGLKQQLSFLRSLR